MSYIKREDVLKHKRKMSGADFGGEYWDEAVLCEDIRKIPTADVVPREIVETMHKTIERLEAEKDALIKNYAECQKAYAREIFAEIKRRCANVSRIEYGGFQYYPLGDKFFDELKKKYTEEK